MGPRGTAGEKAQLIRFGIPSLDNLLGKPPGPLSKPGIAPPGPKATTSICLIGRDGTGKSVLALHLAARYLADSLESSDDGAKVIYFSTDLSYAKADQIWKNFDLSRPNQRCSPFDTNDTRASHKAIKVSLEDMEVKVEKISGYLRKSASRVAFIDLAGPSVGDEWGFLNQVLANLPNNPVPRHLLIIDAVEGLETMVGERDAYGEERSRRSRVAQVMRLARKKCHLLFIVEDASEGQRQPEEFVSDVVIRLRATEINRYSRRTVEIDKVRGQTHARGQHAFSLRRGGGSVTTQGGTLVKDSPPSTSAPRRVPRKYVQNYDDPRVPETGPSQSYVLALPSLHLQSREAMGESAPSNRGVGAACMGFGIPYLDNMLPRSRKGQWGLPLGTVTALIGDPRTQKRHLGRAFLGECFKRLGQELLSAPGHGSPASSRSGGTLRPPKGIRSLADLCAESLKGVKGGPRRSPEDWARCLTEALKHTGASVLITNEDVDAYGLAEEFANAMVEDENRVLKKRLAGVLREIFVTRIVCRRLEIHDLSASILLHIVRQATEGARKRIAEQMGPSGLAASTGIRLVIDDFSTWREIYPDIRNEPQLLPSLLFYLRREGVAGLIIDSHTGRPDTPMANLFDSELRALVDHHLYTWRVPFYGESRIAIATSPPRSGIAAGRRPGVPQRSVVRELKRRSPEQDQQRLEVDPHFELYMGLEKGLPEPVPLEVRLFEEVPQFSEYIAALNLYLGGLFAPLPESDKVVVGVRTPEYGTLRDWCRIHNATRLDHTLIVQVDEFWMPRRLDAFRPQATYLNELTWKKGRPDEVVDPDAVFRPPADSLWKPGKESFRRFEFFEENGYDLAKKDCALAQIDRVPFMWDFGFLVCRLEPWTTRGDLEIPMWGKNDPGVTVRDVWKRLPKAYGCGDDLADDGVGHEPSRGPRASWREFLGACKVLSHAHSASGTVPLPPFDLCNSAPESFSCLVLEIWASEAYKRLAGRPNLSRHIWETEKRPRIDLEEYALELYRTWLLLVDVLDLPAFAAAARPFNPVPREADVHSIAVRHWYKTACAAQRTACEETLVPVGLPGHFTTRGDWFLAAENESRSSRLADRAIDILSSRCANFTRMQVGIGLPTRFIASRPEDESRLRTFLRSPCAKKPGVVQAAHVANVSYGDLRSLGECRSDKFRWLWRSSLWNYDHLACIWQKSLVRMAIAWSDFQRECGTNWVPGFQTYDFLVKYTKFRPGPGEKGFAWVHEKAWKKDDAASYRQFRESWPKFQEMCALVMRLFQDATDRKDK